VGPTAGPTVKSPFCLGLGSPSATWAGWAFRSKQFACKLFNVHSTSKTFVMRTTGPRINDMGHLTNSRSSRTNFAPFGGLAPDIRSAIVNLISFMFGLGWVGLGWVGLEAGPPWIGGPFSRFTSESKRTFVHYPALDQSLSLPPHVRELKPCRPQSRTDPACILANGLEPLFRP